MTLMTLYVTNLPPGVGAADLIPLFAEHGPVTAAEIRDGFNGRTGHRAGVIEMCKGWGTAIVALHRRKYLGRTLDVGMIWPWE
jgi:hypothetical protein